MGTKGKNTRNARRAAETVRPKAEPSTTAADASGSGAANDIAQTAAEQNSWAVAKQEPGKKRSSMNTHSTKASKAKRSKALDKAEKLDVKREQSQAKKDRRDKAKNVWE